MTEALIIAHAITRTEIPFHTSLRWQYIQIQAQTSTQFPRPKDSAANVQSLSCCGLRKTSQFFVPTAQMGDDILCSGLEARTLRAAKPRAVFYRCLLGPGCYAAAQVAQESLGETTVAVVVAVVGDLGRATELIQYCVFL